MYLDAQENILPVQEIKEHPLHHHIADSHDHKIVRITRKLTKPLEETVGHISPVDEASRHINKNGVHTDDGEEERPPLVSLYIDDIIEERQQHQAPAAHA